MSKLKAVIILIRFPNLIFIFLTQLLSYYFMVAPAVRSQGTTPTLSNFYIVLLCLSTVLIAAAGYMINDYFDIGIDAINKPDKVTIEKIFKRRTIIIWHITLNIIALALVSYISLRFVQFKLIIIQLISILLLVFYSTTFKRKLIIGNLTIAVLTSLSLLTIAFYEPKFDLFSFDYLHAKLLWMYVLFSFTITFIREVIKDIEDVKGDTAQNCETIPLVWGISIAKLFVYILLVLLLLLLIVTLLTFYSVNMVLVIYMTITVFFPLIFIFFKTVKAVNSAEFHTISTYTKLVTLSGILSMTLL